MFKLVPEYIPEEIKKKYTPEHLEYLASQITITSASERKEGIKNDSRKQG